MDQTNIDTGLVTTSSTTGSALPFSTCPPKPVPRKKPSSSFIPPIIPTTAKTNANNLITSDEIDENSQTIVEKSATSDKSETDLVQNNDASPAVVAADSSVSEKESNVKLKESKNNVTSTTTHLDDVFGKPPNTDASSESSNQKNEDINLVKPRNNVNPPKPLARAASLPPSDFTKIVPKPIFHKEVAGDSNGLAEIAEEPSDLKSKQKLPRKPPPPRPKIIPPPKPKLTPPPPPPQSCLNERDISTEKISSPPSKQVARKESASKKIDLLKKKGMQIKEKSLKVFKSRTSHSDPDDLEEVPKTDGLRPTSPHSNVFQEPNSSTAENEKKHITPDTTCTQMASKVYPNSAEKPRRAPPPRPALPSVLKSRRASEPPIHLSESIIDQESNTCVKAPVSAVGHDNITKTDDKAEGVSSSAFDNSMTIRSENCRENQEISCILNNKNNGSPAELNNSTVSPQHKAKPARPPPIQLSDSTMVVTSTKQRVEKSEDEEVSFLDLVKGKEGDKPKPEVDEKMKEYFSGELYCIATADYESINFTDLSFSAGERIFVSKKLDNGMLFGRNENGEEGPFPGKYVCLEDN